MCLDECPVAAICEGDPYRIDAGHCLECGRCVEFCPENAIIAAAGL
jgi:uncharacterized Fe-S center protein